MLEQTSVGAMESMNADFGFSNPDCWLLSCEFGGEGSGNSKEGLKILSGQLGLTVYSPKLELIKESRNGINPPWDG